MLTRVCLLLSSNVWRQSKATEGAWSQTCHNRVSIYSHTAGTHVHVEQNKSSACDKRKPKAQLQACDT